MPQATASVGSAKASIIADSVPLEVERLEQIHRIPLLLGVFLAIVGAIAIGHLLVTSVRRRRRDFAVLKSVGFTAVKCSQRWHGKRRPSPPQRLLLGLSLGLVLGVLLWHAVAHQIGVLANAEVPAEILAAIAFGTIIAIDIIVAFPAVSAAHTQAAATLRSE